MKATLNELKLPRHCVTQGARKGDMMYFWCEILRVVVNAKKKKKTVANFINVILRMFYYTCKQSLCFVKIFDQNESGAMTNKISRFVVIHNVRVHSQVTDSNK